MHISNKVILLNNYVHIYYTNLAQHFGLLNMYSTCMDYRHIGTIN